MSALPVAKLAALVVKQLAKPLANLAKEKAKESYFFRTYICMPPAQFYHRCEVKLKMWAMNLGKAVEIPKLNEAMAIELGGTLLGEGIIFITGAVLVTAEVVRRNKKDTAIEQARRNEMESILDRLRDMEIESSRQDAQLREINRLCLALQSSIAVSQSQESAGNKAKNPGLQQQETSTSDPAGGSSSKP
ncbi:putative OPA3-like protein CG13603 isoform X2 [Daphnia carinata]|uniref:putative OPA3-like protein CG13603 isoform X2 n=1 Tax=Daphnia carinata TaxID=120202 RepID=UPI00257FD570|nr:putative OPA3-like protein CG13603 isoform X2 [Daphnia carinata]